MCSASANVVFALAASVSLCHVEPRLRDKDFLKISEKCRSWARVMHDCSLCADTAIVVEMRLDTAKRDRDDGGKGDVDSSRAHSVDTRSNTQKTSL